MKKKSDFYLKTFGFLVVKFSIYLNRPVFVIFAARLTFRTSRHIAERLTVIH